MPAEWAAGWVDHRTGRQLERALATPARIVWLESPSNPLLKIVDLAKAIALAKRAGALTVVDNTFATPALQRPLSLGADVTLQAATKYLGGHHDLTAGVVVGSRALIDTLWSTQICLGATLSPMDAWLLLRGLRTLALRVRQHNASALQLARWLEQQPQVERVDHPGLESHPQHALARRQMSGFGGVMNIVIRGDYDEASRFVHALRLPRQAVSLGGVESLVVHTAAMWRGTMNDEQMRVAGARAELTRSSGELRERGAQLERRAERLGDELATARREAEELAARRTQLQAAHRQTGVQLSLLTAELAELEADRSRCDERRAAQQDTLAELRVRLAARESAREALARLERAREGYGAGVRAIFSGGTAVDLTGVVGTVADLLEVPTGLETAVEAVLGDRLQWVVVERFDQAPPPIVIHNADDKYNNWASDALMAHIKTRYSLKERIGPFDIYLPNGT